VLIETAARLLAEHGPDALTARRVAREIGASTMALYTHFNGMDELRRAIRDEGFARLATQWGTVAQTDDPVADLSVSGATYTLFALRNPNLYRAMFFDTPGDDVDAPLNIAGGELAIIQRCIDAGRFHPAEPLSLAWQLWAATHGVVAGLLAGVIDPASAEQHLGTLGQTIYVGFGDDPDAAKRSIERTRHRVQTT